jgi:hypothetical protein
MSAAPAQVAPDSEELAAAILESLAQVRAAPVSELREEMATAGGDLEIDSLEAEAVIAMRTLATVDDLEPECLLSLESLTELIHRRWPAGHPIAQSGSR